jgi:molybdopterin molybdotransferase
MLSYTDALKLILTEASLRPIRSVPYQEALGKISAESVISLETLPPFDNSAMDGFAVVTSEMLDASSQNPITLKIAGTAAAGDAPSCGIEGKMGAWEIMTGAPVPGGYDAVICVEDSSRSSDGQNVTLTEHAFEGKNIRRAGTDINKGDELLTSGTFITPAILMGLSAAGVSEINIYQDVTAAVISTGKELISDAGTPLKAGQIRNSNGPYLMAELSALGVKARHEGTIYDEVEAFDKKLQDILSDAPQIILSTGAVSMGKYDFIPDALKRAGAEIIFHKSAIRPGKPILFARLPNGTFYFGLPGNPIAAACGLAFFTAPLIRAMRGQKQLQSQTAALMSDYVKKSSFRFFQKAFVFTDEDGLQKVDIFQGQESYKILPFARANCWAIIEEEAHDLKAGSRVQIIKFNS